MAEIVLIHAPEDAASADRLAEAAARTGYGVARHDAASEAITGEIAEAGAAIVLWSEAASASEWIRAEANVARGLRKLVQVSADGRPPPLPFDPAQSVSILTWTGDEEHPAWRGIASALEGLCGTPPQPAAPAPVATPTQPPSPPPAAAAPAKEPNTLLIVAIGLLLLAAVAAGLFWLRGRPAETPAPVAESNPQPVNEQAPVEPEAAPAPAAAERFDHEAVVRESAGHALVRSAPSDLGFAIARVEAGDTVATYQQDGRWWRVRTGEGRTGYMLAASLALRDQAVTAAPEAAAAPAAPPTAQRRAERRPRASRIRKENSEVMLAFCQGAGAGTPQCRTFRRQLGDR